MSSPAGEDPTRRGQGRSPRRAQGEPKGSLDGSRTMGERRANGAAHTLRADPGLQFSGLSTAPKARAPGRRAGGGPAGRAATSRPQRGAGRPANGPHAPRSPSGGGGAGGAQGRTPHHRKTPHRSAARPPGRPRSQRPVAGAEKPGGSPAQPPGGSRPGPKPEGRGKGGPGGATRWRQTARSKGRATEQGARTGADGTAKPDGASERDGKAAGTRPPGTERGSRGEPRGPGDGERKRGRSAPDRSREAGAGARGRTGTRAGEGAPAQGGTEGWPKKGAGKAEGRGPAPTRAYIWWRGHRRAPSRATWVGPGSGPGPQGAAPHGGRREPAKRAKRRGAAAPQRAQTSGRAKRRPRAARAVCRHSSTQIRNSAASFLGGDGGPAPRPGGRGRAAPTYGRASAVSST